jgi:hypothetical protein
MSDGRRVRLFKNGRTLMASSSQPSFALGHTLVTDNEREFDRAPDLACENRLR